jgi:C4-dicarboxylate transporter DctM subunit
MFPLLVGGVSFLVMVLLAISGVPIFVALGLVGVVGLIFVTGFDATLGIIGTLPFAVLASYGLAVVPLFYLMGEIAAEAGIARDAYQAAYKLLGGLRGGLAMSTTLGSGFSAACMGSSVANAALFTKVAFPEMLRFKYDRSLSLGCIASSGTFAIMIPPSIALVVYGIITEESVGRLLMAGILPGILTLVVYLTGIWIRCRLNPKLAPIAPIKYTMAEKIKGTFGLWGIAALFVLVLGGIYAGFFTPSAGGAVGAFGAFILALSKRRLTKVAINRIALDSMMGITSIIVIIIGGFLLARHLVLSGFVEALVHFTTTQAGLPPIVIIGFIAVMYILLGCVMDGVSMMVCTMPFVYPVVTSLGFDGIWFGIIFIKLIEIALITPPIGANLYIVAAAAGKDTNVIDVIRGVLPFLLLDCIVLVLLILFPAISLYLPSRMYAS